MKLGTALMIGLLLSLAAADFNIPTMITKAHNPAEKHSFNKIEGIIRMNGHTWETHCKCAKTELDLEESTCNPSNLKIFTDKKGDGIDVEQIRKLMGDIKKYNWARVSKSFFTCVDGRVSKESLSTPGGDAGEFILALHTYQNYFGQKMEMSQKTVDEIFRLYLTHMEAKVFNMCTDDESIDHLEKSLSVFHILILGRRVEYPQTSRKSSGEHFKGSFFPYECWRSSSQDDAKIH